MKKIIIAAATVSILSIAIPASAASSSWGLDRISATGVGGSGVKVYVLDTGVANDPGFAGRLSGDIGDCNGHGTHVAGIIGSSQFGVARSAQIVSIKVADCAGNITSGNLISGINRVLSYGGTGVVNMSLTIGKDASVDAAVNKLYSAGFIPVVAAGNSNSDACSYSPGDVANAITVAGTNINDYRTNDSNWGSCVDIFAPGGLITSEDAFNPSGSSVKIGTSMAAAHVSGAAAVYMSSSGLKGQPVIDAILSGASSGVVIDPKGSTNKLLKVITSPIVQPISVPTITPVAITPVKATFLNISAMVLSWNGTDGVSYRVEQSKDGIKWTLFGESTTKNIKLTSFGYYRIVINTLVSSVIRIG